jgi:hypothetical protein
MFEHHNDNRPGGFLRLSGVHLGRPMTANDEVGHQDWGVLLSRKTLTLISYSRSPAPESRVRCGSPLARLVDAMSDTGFYRRQGEIPDE